MNRLTLPGPEPTVEECASCQKSHNCWECEIHESIVNRLWMYEEYLGKLYDALCCGEEDKQ